MQPKADYFDALVDRNLLTKIAEPTPNPMALQALARGAVIGSCHCAATGSLNADAMTYCLLCF